MCQLEAIYRHSTVNSKFTLHVVDTGQPGRPSYFIAKETLEELRGLNFSWNKIAEIFGVSRFTISRRVTEYGLSELQKFSSITDEEVDEIVRDYMSRHGSTTGEPFLTGYFRSLGVHIQRRRVRSSINRIDPKNTALRWGILVSRRKYHVPWPNSMWHIDGHHSLIRWKFVIHGCCDGFSRKIMFLYCSTNNLAATVLKLFEHSILDHDNLWPSRIRVDFGVENVQICDAMVANRGEGRGSFIAGPSTRNQRIERLWRDVFRCVCQFFYYHFYAMEQTGLLDLDNPIHMFVLHIVFITRINTALLEFKNMFNSHRLSTERNWTPNQIWINGMLDPNNPLGKNEVENIEADEFFGEDPNGPINTGDNNVVVTPENLPDGELLTSYVHQRIDVNRVSMKGGIDVYSDVLSLVVNKMEEM